MRRVLPLLSVFLLVSLFLSHPAPAQKPSDRVFGIQQIPEGGDRAEREQLPVCFCYLGRLPPAVDTEGFDRTWKEMVERLGKECVVITARHPEKGADDFYNLNLRTKEASLRLEFFDVVLVDPWQEERLGAVTMNFVKLRGLEDQRKLSGDFLDGVKELAEKAKAWKTAHAPKPEKWTDAKDRAMTATAVAWDGKTAVFRLQAGKTAKLDAAALSEDTRNRLAKLYPPKFPFVSANDPKALEEAAGQQVCVVGRVERVQSGSWLSTETLKYRPFSAFFAMKYDSEMDELFRKRNSEGARETRGRAYGLLEKETGPDMADKYTIRITDPRQFGPGAAAE